MFATAKQRREHDRENIPFVFGATADLYNLRRGEFFHLAVFEEGDDTTDFDGACSRTHERYFKAIRGARGRTHSRTGVRWRRLRGVDGGADARRGGGR